MCQSKKFGLQKLYQIIEENAQFCKIDVQFALEFCVLERQKNDQVGAYIVVDAYIPLNTELKTNISYALPVFCFPLGVKFHLEADCRFLIGDLECLAEKHGKAASEMLHFCNEHAEFNAEHIFSRISSLSQFRKIVLETLQQQMPHNLKSDYLSLVEV